MRRWRHRNPAVHYSRSQPEGTLARPEERASMARHAEDTRNRGVAGWIIGSSIAGVVLVAALIAYFAFLRNDASDAADTGCSGSSTVQVVAGASAPALSQIADAYNATRPSARGVCVSVQVSPLPSADAADALSTGWTN